MSFDANDTAYGVYNTEATDLRITELEEAVMLAEGTMKSALHNAQRRLFEIKERDARIAELESELAKARELPPLPESVQAHLRNCRVAGPVLQWTRDLIVWEDTHYPKPPPQWELDAQYLERILGDETRSAYSTDEVKAIAARLREANRAAK